MCADTHTHRWRVGVRPSELRSPTLLPSVLRREETRTLTPGKYTVVTQTPPLSQNTPPGDTPSASANSDGQNRLPNPSTLPQKHTPTFRESLPPIDIPRDTPRFPGVSTTYQRCPPRPRSCTTTARTHPSSSWSQALVTRRQRPDFPFTPHPGVSQRSLGLDCVGPIDEENGRGNGLGNQKKKEKKKKWKANRSSLRGGHYPPSDLGAPGRRGGRARRRSGSNRNMG